MKLASIRTLLLAMSVVAASDRRASGGAYEVPMQASKAAAQADAFTAQADDPSAIFYNPAGICQLPGTQISGGAYYLQPQFHFHGDDGSNERLNNPTVLPHLYAESDFGLPRVHFGIGINDVQGLNENWGNSGPLRTIVDRAFLEVINIAPSAAFQVDEHLSLGVAINVYYGDLDLQRNLVIAAPPVPEARFRLRGHDWAIGVTPGLLYKFDDSNQVGLYYRSPYTFDFDGHAQVTSRVIPEIGPSKARESLNFPQSAGIGYAVRPLERLVIEPDIVWTDWHTVDELRIKSPNPAFNNQTLPAHWKSGFTYRLGGNYQLNENWNLRAGYAYGQNSIPQSTFSPVVPDSNYHLFATGFGYSQDFWELDLAVNYILRERRHIANNVNSPTVDGTWSNEFYGLMLTYTVKL